MLTSHKNLHLKKTEQLQSKVANQNIQQTLKSFNGKKNEKYNQQTFI